LYIACSSQHARGSTAIVGGVNIGDRFRDWADLAVQLFRAADVAVLAAALELPSSFIPYSRGCVPQVTFAINAPSAFCPLRFAARVPFTGSFCVAESLTSFYHDPSLLRYTVATAYLDDAGEELLMGALLRGAHLVLITPRVPNVYRHANKQALCRLLRAAPPGRLRVLLHNGTMMHAKCSVGTRLDGCLCAYIGSANLKARSLTQFGEVLLFLEGGTIASDLLAALERLAADSVWAESVADIGIYDPALALIESHLG
jgi:phosphatidylserine/phosphatidylglycerophosphate/cardiolipin synthase-like enzyme